MARSLKIQKPRRSQIRKIEQLLSQDLHPKQLRRAQAVLLYAEGMSGVDIAAALRVNPLTIYSDLRAFAHKGLDSLKAPPRGGASKQLGRAEEAEVLRIAELSPIDLGLPFARWSLAKLREYLLKQRVIKTISREHLRRLLKKGASDCCASSAKSSAVTRSG